MHNRKTPQKTCYSILANCLFKCSPIKLLLLVSVGITALIYRQSVSDLFFSSPVVLPKPEVEIKPLLIAPSRSMNHRKVIKPFFKPKCDLFVDGVKYGSSRTAVGCLFKDNECKVTFTHVNQVNPFAHDSVFEAYVYQNEDSNLPIRVTCNLKRN